MDTVDHTIAKEVFRVRRGITGGGSSGGGATWPQYPAAFGEFGEVAFATCEAVAREALIAVCEACEDLSDDRRAHLRACADFGCGGQIPVVAATPVSSSLPSSIQSRVLQGRQGESCPGVAGGTDPCAPTISASPFDFFLYHGSPVQKLTGGDGGGEVVSSNSGHITQEYASPVCGEHVDPGLLTVVPVSAIPGLAVRRHDTGLWEPVEDGLWRSADRERSCAADPPAACVVIGGWALQRLTEGRFLATVHRVDNCGHQRRLSCVYELRPLAALQL